jgi:hypothetical protein
MTYTNFARERVQVGGTGNLTIEALPGYPRLSMSMGPGDKTPYVVLTLQNVPIECGMGTLVDADTFQRLEIFETVSGGVLNNTSPTPADIPAGTFLHFPVLSQIVDYFARTDEGNEYTAPQSGALGTVDDPDAPITDDGTDLVIDLSKRQFFFFEFPDGDPRNLAAPLNVPAGITSGAIWFKQSAGGGSVLTASAEWIPLNGVMPNIAVGADEISRLDFIVNPDGDIEFNLTGPWEASP